ncbi:MAG: Smr/MutS family protein [Alphaproteobacteria bacterium]|nr:Smr/MutS family protein [Alphaproteobacteria bacterium]MBR1649455.1 Smr/MutS family protein [Alphaproteobacteria bacterium]
MDSIDDDFWKEIIKDIVPLKSDKKDLSRKKVLLTVTRKITPSTVYAGEPLERLDFDEAKGIDANTFRRFKTGRMPLDGKLDLHGYTEDQAFEKVTNFIKSSYLKSFRCVEIITGKGLHAQSDSDFFKSRGVLKDRVPQWLNSPELRSLILAITHPEHTRGGSGVIRILLRRRKYL